MDLAALVLAGLSLVVSVLALLSSRSKDEEANRIALDLIREQGVDAITAISGTRRKSMGIRIEASSRRSACAWQ